MFCLVSALAILAKAQAQTGGSTGLGGGGDGCVGEFKALIAVVEDELKANPSVKEKIGNQGIQKIIASLNAAEIASVPDLYVTDPVTQLLVEAVWKNSNGKNSITLGQFWCKKPIDRQKLATVAHEGASLAGYERSQRYDVSKDIFRLNQEKLEAILEQDRIKKFSKLHEDFGLRGRMLKSGTMLMKYSNALDIAFERDQKGMEAAIKDLCLELHHPLAKLSIKERYQSFLSSSTNKSIYGRLESCVTAFVFGSTEQWFTQYFNARLESGVLEKIAADFRSKVNAENLREEIKKWIDARASDPRRDTKIKLAIKSEYDWAGVEMKKSGSVGWVAYSCADTCGVNNVYPMQYLREKLAMAYMESEGKLRRFDNNFEKPFRFRVTVLQDNDFEQQPRMSRVELQGSSGYEDLGGAFFDRSTGEEVSSLNPIRWRTRDFHLFSRWNQDLLKDEEIYGRDRFNVTSAEKNLPEALSPYLVFPIKEIQTEATPNQLLAFTSTSPKYMDAEYVPTLRILSMIQTSGHFWNRTYKLMLALSGNPCVQMSAVALDPKSQQAMDWYGYETVRGGDYTEYTFECDYYTDFTQSRMKEMSTSKR